MSVTVAVAKEEAEKEALTQGVGVEAGEAVVDTVLLIVAELAGDKEGVRELDKLGEPDTVEDTLEQAVTEGLRDPVPLALLHLVSVRVAVPLTEITGLLVGEPESEECKLTLGAMVALSVG